MKLLKLVIIAFIVVAITIPIAVYAAYYAGGEKVTVSFTLELEDVGDVSISVPEVESEQMGVFSFYDVLRGHPPSRNVGYIVFVSLNQSGDVTTLSQAVNPEADVPVDMSFEFFNMDRGATTLRIYVEYVYTQSVVYDNDWAVNIG